MPNAHNRNECFWTANVIFALNQQGHDLKLIIHHFSPEAIVFFAEGFNERVFSLSKQTACGMMMINWGYLNMGINRTQNVQKYVI